MELETRVRDVPPEHLFAARPDVGDVDAEHFQTLFKLFDGEVSFVQHGGCPFRNGWLVGSVTLVSFRSA